MTMQGYFYLTYSFDDNIAVTELLKAIRKNHETL